MKNKVNYTREFKVKACELVLKGLILRFLAYNDIIT